MIGPRRSPRRLLMAAFVVALIESRSAVAQLAGTNIAVGRRPIRALLSADERSAFVLLEGAETLAVIDIAGASVVKQIPVPYNPLDLAGSPDGRYVYVASSSSPIGFPFPPDDCSMIVVNPSTGWVTAVDVATRTVAFTVLVTSGIPAFIRPSRRGDLLVVTTLDGNLAVVDLATRSSRPIAPLGFQVGVEPLIHPDDRRVFILGGLAAPDLSILDLSTGAIRSFSFAGEGFHVGLWGTLTLDPSGRYLFIPGHDLSYGVAYTVIFDTQTESFAAAVPGTFGSIVFSADGARAFVFSDNEFTGISHIVEIPTFSVLGTLPVAAANSSVLSADRTRAYLCQTGAPFNGLTIWGVGFQSPYDLTTFDLVTNTVIRQDIAPDLIACSAGRAMAISADGKRLIVGNPALDNVTLFSIPDPPPGSSYYTLNPCRILDTREPTFGSTGQLGGPSLGASSTRTFPVSGLCGVPSTARAVALHATATGAAADGHLAFGPHAAALSGTASLNYRAGRVRGNAAVVTLGAAGTLAVECVQPGGGSVDLVLDVTGYWQ